MSSVERTFPPVVTAVGWRPEDGLAGLGAGLPVRPDARDAAGTARWWLATLEPVVARQADAAAKPRRYWSGHHDDPLELREDEIRADVRRLVMSLTLNTCRLAVDVRVDRLEVEAFRVESGRSRSGSNRFDGRAWSWWQGSNGDELGSLVAQEMLVAGVAAVSVDLNTAGLPVFSGETADQVAVALDPVDRRSRLAAVKRWRDAWGVEHANVWVRADRSVGRPGRLYRWQQVKPSADEQLRGATIRWAPRADGVPMDADGGVVLPWDEVPVIPVLNRQALGVDAQSELADMIPLQNGLNLILCDLLIAADLSAQQQKWMSGLRLERDEQGNPKPAPFVSMVNRMFTSELADAKFGSFEQLDLRIHVAALEAVMDMIGTVGRIPPHFLGGPRGQWPTGDSLRAGELPLTSRLRGIQSSLGRGFEDVIRAAAGMTGDARRAAGQVEVLWKDVEQRSESERADALVKRKDIGVPMSRLLLDAGYSQEQVTEWTSAGTLIPATELKQRAEVMQIFAASGVDVVEAARMAGLPDPVRAVGAPEGVPGGSGPGDEVEDDSDPGA